MHKFWAKLGVLLLLVLLLLALLLACLHFAAFTISLHFLNKLCGDCDEAKATKETTRNWLSCVFTFCFCRAFIFVVVAVVAGFLLLFL